MIDADHICGVCSETLEIIDVDPRQPVYYCPACMWWEPVKLANPRDELQREW